MHIQYILTDKNGWYYSSSFQLLKKFDILKQNSTLFHNWCPKDDHDQDQESVFYKPCSTDYVRSRVWIRKRIVDKSLLLNIDNNNNFKSPFLKLVKKTKESFIETDALETLMPKSSNEIFNDDIENIEENFIVLDNLKCNLKSTPQLSIPTFAISNKSSATIYSAAYFLDPENQVYIRISFAATIPYGCLYQVEFKKDYSYLCSSDIELLDKFVCSGSFNPQSALILLSGVAVNEKCIVYSKTLSADIPTEDISTDAPCLVLSDSLDSLASDIDFSTIKLRLNKFTTSIPLIETNFMQWKLYKNTRLWVKQEDYVRKFQDIEHYDEIASATIRCNKYFSFLVIFLL